MTRSKSTTWAPPEEFAEYRVVRVLGEGAMGKVFLAQDTVLDRPVALKFLGSRDLDGQARDRFLIEARALARLQHPNVVAVYRVGELGKRPYLVSEFVHGQSLDKVPKPIESKRVHELAIGLARGLSAAHRRGVLHRDIKPGNTILTDENEVKLLDFGLAKFTTESSPVASSGSHPVVEPVDRSRLTPVPPDQTSRQLDPFEATHDINRTANLADPPVAIVAPAPSDPNGTAVLASSSSSSSSAASSSPSLTRAGAVMGTPYYMAPEIWRGEPATERSDLYSLGVLLYELLTGMPPHRSAVLTELAVLVQDNEPPPFDPALGVTPELSAIVMRCLSRDATARFGSADEMRAELEALTASRSTPTPIPEGNPYPGLQAFEAAQQSVFFGRETEVRAVVERLRTDSFVVVAGDSGVGKSSVCHAGVGPMIVNGALDDGRTWQVVAMQPGRRPILALVTALATPLGLEPNALENALATRDGGQLGELRRTALRALGTARGVLLVLDHFEEFATLAGTEEASAVAEFLAELLATRSKGFRLLGAVRGDYVTRIANLHALGDQLARALYVLRPMTPEGIRRAIVGPLAAKGGRFESDALVDELVAAAQVRGGLPLVQFALAELWSTRSPDGVIPKAALVALGGVAGALARHADSVVGALREAERTEAARILLALVAADGTRTQRTRDELVDASRASEVAFEALLKGRLVATRDDEGDASFELAHDALIQGWERLRRWLDDDGERRIVRRRIEAAGEEWRRHDRSSDLVWRDRQLLEAEVVPYASLGDVSRAFLDASRAAARRARVRRLALAIGIPLAILAIVVFVRMRIQAAADEQIATEARERGVRVDSHVAAARTQLDGASTNEAIAERRAAAFARFDARDLAGAEPLWAVVLSDQRTLDAKYSLASQELEHALVIDPARDDVRKKLAEILNRRARLADDMHQNDRREELLRRLALYDPDHVFLREWTSPAKLAITTDPAAATLSIAAIERDGIHRVERAARPIEPSATVAPGDYVVTATANDRATVRYPIRIHANETLPIRIDLPAKTAVPSDYVFVPAGRFLVGSADEGARTSFLSTVPLHEAKTDAFLIAKNETTFGDWIAFLDAIPLDAREQHRPRTPGSPSMGGQIEVVRDGDHWKLVLQPTTEIYASPAGSPIRYFDRTTRGEQDWSKLPVLGVSLVDVRAYTAWLSSTGRVPNARPCTELEWERAARGADDREFPHGDTLIATEANYDETYGKLPRAFGPDAIGSYPASRSPFGVDDLAGNAFEWTTSSLSNDAAAMRGGAFYFGALTARTTNRNTLEPTARSVQLGVRVCASAPK